MGLIRLNVATIPFRVVVFWRSVRTCLTTARKLPPSSASPISSRRLIPTGPLGAVFRTLYGKKYTPMPAVNAVYATTASSRPGQTSKSYWAWLRWGHERRLDVPPRRGCPVLPRLCKNGAASVVQRLASGWMTKALLAKRKDVNESVAESGDAKLDVESDRPGGVCGALAASAF